MLVSLMDNQRSFKSLPADFHTIIRRTDISGCLEGNALNVFEPYTFKNFSETFFPIYD